MLPLWAAMSFFWMKNWPSLLSNYMPVHCLLDSFWFWSRLSLGDGVMEIYANEFPRGESSSNNYWISSGQGRFGKYRTIFPSFCKMLILLFTNSWFGCMDLSSWIFLFLYTLTENVVDRSGEWREIYKRVMIVNVLHFRQCCVVTFFIIFLQYNK